MSSKVLKVISIIVLVLGMIGGVILGAKYKTYAIAPSFSDFMYMQVFNTALMLAAWVVTGLVFVSLYALGGILDNQEVIISKMYNQEKKIERILNGESAYDKLAEMSKSLDSGKWVCSKCGEPNVKTSRVCNNCGAGK
jgi:hypothetical protein